MSERRFGCTARSTPGAQTPSSTSPPSPFPLPACNYCNRLSGLPRGVGHGPSVAIPNRVEVLAPSTDNLNRRRAPGLCNSGEQSAAEEPRMDMRLELVTVPVSDVDRAKA